jgi:hypothetical protein
VATGIPERKVLWIRQATRQEGPRLVFPRSSQVRLDLEQACNNSYILDVVRLERVFVFHIEPRLFSKKANRHETLLNLGLDAIVLKHSHLGQMSCRRRRRIELIFETWSSTVTRLQAKRPFNSIANLRPHSDPRKPTTRKELNL